MQKMLDHIMIAQLLLSKISLCSMAAQSTGIKKSHKTCVSGVPGGRGKPGSTGPVGPGMEFPASRFFTANLIKVVLSKGQTVNYERL